MIAQGQPPPALVGRDAELAQLRAVLDAGTGERARLVLISGEAGIGKSALAAAFAGEARARGLLVLSAACYDLAGAPPYGPWEDLTRDWDAHEGMPSLPAFVTDPQALDALAGGESLRQGVADFLGAAARARPLAIVLEDLHWADHASLELLRFVARRMPALPIVLVATFREDGLNPEHPLHRLLPLLVRESRALRISLRRLAPDDVGTLVRARYELSEGDEARLAAWLDTYAGGNPFYVEELLYTLEHEQVLAPGKADWSLGDLSVVRMPALVRQVIDERLAWLDTETLRLVQVAAVIGAEVPVDLWSTAAEASEDDLARAIEQAQRAWLIEEVPGHGGFRFRHALIREALYNSLVLPRRRACHRRIAEALSAGPNADADAVAHHFRQAGDPRAVIWLVRAGERAARNYAWMMAVERLQAALDLLGPGQDTDLKRALLLYHTGMLSRRWNITDSIRRLQEASRLATALGNQPLLGLIATDLGLLHCIGGRISRGLRETEAGIELLERAGAGAGERFLDLPADTVEFSLPSLLPPPDTRRAFRVNWLAIAGRYSDAIAEGAAFVARIPAHPHHARYQDYYDAYIGLGHAAMMLGRPDEARAALDAARAGYAAVEQMPWVYFLNEIAFVVNYRLDRADERQALRSLLQTTWERSTGATARVARGQSPVGSIRMAYLRGDWDDAEQWARSTVEQEAVGLGLLAAIRVLIQIAHHRGNLAAAWEVVSLARGRESLLTFGETWLLGANAINAAAAQLALDAGDIEQATAWIDLHGRWIAESGAVIGRSEHAQLLARQAALGDDPAAADRHAREALALASQPYQPYALLLARRALGRLAFVADRPAEAGELLNGSLALAVACDTPFDRALTRIELAALALERHDSAAARTALEDARAVATRLRAEPALARIAELEARLAEPARPVPAAGISERELEVLRLVARGMTDAEVAAALYISPRTVGGHLQSIYTKLGISTRTAATALAYERGLI